MCTNHGLKLIITTTIIIIKQNEYHNPRLNLFINLRWIKARILVDSHIF